LSAVIENFILITKNPATTLAPEDCSHNPVFSDLVFQILTLLWSSRIQALIKDVVVMAFNPPQALPL